MAIFASSPDGMMTLDFYVTLVYIESKLLAVGSCCEEK